MLGWISFSLLSYVSMVSGISVAPFFISVIVLFGQSGVSLGILRMLLFLCLSLYFLDDYVLLVIMVLCPPLAPLEVVPVSS